MSHPRTFLPPEVLDRSRERELRARRRRRIKFVNWFLPSRFERRDALVVLLVLACLGVLLAYTRVLDRWFDRFNGNRPDQRQSVEALSGSEN